MELKSDNLIKLYLFISLIIYLKYYLFYFEAQSEIEM